MIPRGVLVLLLAASLRGCLTYEYEHEFWLRVDGSGTVTVTGRPELWSAFKGTPAGAPAAMAEARRLFESSGLRVRQVTLTHRSGREYLFVTADFRDVNALSGTPAFPDLTLTLREEGSRLRLEGSWRAKAPRGGEGEGLMAVRFHLPSRVYDHKNAALGVERGNIVSWREEVSPALAGRPLEFGATMDKRSILWSTVGLFATAIGVAAVLLSGTLYWAMRKGRARVRGGGE
jgi:hypothetical protein